MAIWQSFFIFELAGTGGVAEYNGCLARFKLKKSVPKGHYYLQQAATPHQITQQNSWQRAGGP
jgi:hypothetical protein